MYIIIYSTTGRGVGIVLIKAILAEVKIIILFMIRESLEMMAYNNQLLYVCKKNRNATVSESGRMSHSHGEGKKPSYLYPG